MTVRMIMILLYGAGGEPGRGEIPMTRFSQTVTDMLPTQSNSFTQGVLKTNTALIHSRLYTVGYKSMERRKANA